MKKKKNTLNLLAFIIAIMVLESGFIGTSVVNPISDGENNLQQNVLTPFNASGDTDGDGLSDLDEINIYNTNPSDNDSDDDKILDGWEVDNFLNPLDSDITTSSYYYDSWDTFDYGDPGEQWNGYVGNDCYLRKENKDGHNEVMYLQDEGTGSGEYISLYKTFNPIHNEGIIEWWWRAGTDFCYTDIFGNNGLVTYFIIHGGALKYSHPNGVWYTISNSINLNEWYHIKVVINSAANTYNVYINNNLQMGQIPAKTPFDYANKIQFRTYSSFLGKHWIDAVDVSSDPLYFEGRNLISGITTPYGDPDCDGMTNLEEYLYNRDNIWVGDYINHWNSLNDLDPHDAYNPFEGLQYYIWNLDELSGTTVQNSGTASDGIGTYHNVGMGDYYYGPQGYCKYFVPTDPYNSYIDIPNSQLSVDLNEDLTISFWMQLKNIGEGRINPIDKYYRGEFALTIETSGSMMFYQGIDGGSYIGKQVFPSGTFQNDKWYHITITRDSANKNIESYLFGEQITTHSYNDPVPKSTSPIKIGRGYTNYGAYGRLDEFRVSNKIITPRSPPAGNKQDFNFWRVYSLHIQKMGFGQNTQIPDITNAPNIYIVTDNRDYDPSSESAIPGTLRYAMETYDEKYILFNNDMTIVLKANLGIRSNKVIDGRGYDITIEKYALIINGGWHDIIIENINFQNGIKIDDDHDAIEIRDEAYNIFIDHCSFSDYSDGLIDIWGGSTAITISYCKFTNHFKTFLIGLIDDTRNSATFVTFYHNYIAGNQRMPRLTGGHVHMFNNYITWGGDYTYWDGTLVTNDDGYAGASLDEGELYLEDNIFYKGLESGNDVLISQMGDQFEGFIKTGGNNCKKESIWPWYAYDVNDFQNYPELVFSPSNHYNFRLFQSSAFNSVFEYNLLHYTGAL